MLSAPAHAELAALAAHGPEVLRARAALELTRACRDPEAFAWWWAWLASTSPQLAAPLVGELPPGLVVPLEAVPTAVDALTGSDREQARAWEGVRGEVLRRLDPRDQGTCDVATLVACSPDTHPGVLAAALALLAEAGHPSRPALLRAAEAALRRADTGTGTAGGAPDPDAVLAAATLLAELAPATEDHQRQLADRCARLVERCSPPVRTGVRDDVRAQAPWDRRGDWVGAVLACLRA